MLFHLPRGGHNDTAWTLRDTAQLPAAKCTILARRVYKFLSMTFFPSTIRRRMAQDAISDYETRTREQVCDLPEAVVVALFAELDGPAYDLDIDYDERDQAMREERGRRDTRTLGEGPRLAGYHPCPPSRSGTTYHLCPRSRLAVREANPGLLGQMSRISHRLIGPANWKAIQLGIPLVSSNILRNRLTSALANRGTAAFRKLAAKLPGGKAPVIVGVASGAALVPVAAQAIEAARGGPPTGNDTVLPPECWIATNPPEECCQGESPPEACCDAARLPLPDNCPEVCLGPTCTLPGPDCEANPCPQDFLCCPLDVSPPTSLDSLVSNSSTSPYNTPPSEVPSDWDREFEAALSAACNLPLGPERSRATNRLPEIGRRRTPPMSEEEISSISCDWGGTTRPRSASVPAGTRPPQLSTWYSVPNLTARTYRRRRGTPDRRRRRSMVAFLVPPTLLTNPEARPQLRNESLYLRARRHSGARHRRAVPEEVVYILAGHSAHNPTCSLAATTLALGLDHSMRMNTATHMRYAIRIVDKTHAAGARWTNEGNCQVWEVVRTTFTLSPSTPSGEEEVESLQGNILHPATGRRVPRDPAALSLLTEAVHTIREDETLEDLETLMKCLRHDPYIMDTDDDRRLRRQTNGSDTTEKSRSPHQPVWYRHPGKLANPLDRLAYTIQNYGVQCGATAHFLAVILHKALQEYHQGEEEPDQACRLKDLINTIDGVHWMAWEQSQESPDLCAIWPGVRALLQYKETDYAVHGEQRELQPLLRRALDDEAHETRPVERRLVRVGGRVPTVHRRQPALSWTSARRMAGLLEKNHPWGPTTLDQETQLHTSQDDEAAPRGEKRPASPTWQEGEQGPSASKAPRRDKLGVPRSSSHNYIRPKYSRRKGTRPAPRLMPDITRNGTHRDKRATHARSRLAARVWLDTQRRNSTATRLLRLLNPLDHWISAARRKRSPEPEPFLSILPILLLPDVLEALTPVTAPRNGTHRTRRATFGPSRILAQICHTVRRRNITSPFTTACNWKTQAAWKESVLTGRRRRSPEPAPFFFFPLLLGPGLSLPLAKAATFTTYALASAGTYELAKHLDERALHTTPSPPPVVPPFSAEGNLSFIGVTGKPFVTPPSPMDLDVRRRVMELMRGEPEEDPNPRRRREAGGATDQAVLLEYLRNYSHALLFRNSEDFQATMTELDEAIKPAEDGPTLQRPTGPRTEAGEPPDATSTPSQREGRGVNFFAKLPGLITKAAKIAPATIGKGLVLGGGTTAGGYAVHAMIQSMQPGYDFTSEATANIGIPCFKECNGLQGFCGFCGATGRCCRLGLPGRGCNGMMGGNESHVCIHDSGTEVQDAYNLILYTDQALRQLNGTEHRDHRRFLTQLYGRHQLQSGGFNEQAVLREYLRGYNHIPAFKESEDFQTAVDELAEAVDADPTTGEDPWGTADVTTTAPASSHKTHRVAVQLTRPRRTPDSPHWDPLRFPGAEAYEFPDPIARWQRLVTRTRTKRSGFATTDKLEIYTLINRVCAKRFPELYMTALRKFTYLCSIDNPWPVDGLQAPKSPPPGLATHAPHRSRRDAVAEDLVLLNGTFTSGLAGRLGVAELPAVFWSLLADYLIGASRSPRHSTEVILHAADARLRALGETLGEVTRVRAPTHIRREADDLVTDLRLRRLLDIPCTDGRPMKPRTVTPCEEKLARVTAFLAQDLARVTLPEHLITDRIAIWTADDEQLERLSRQRRDDHSPPSPLLSCEALARQPSYPRPLLNLALSRCLGSKRQVMSILHYLTDQANLLAMNHEHIQWRGLQPPTPGTQQQPRRQRHWDPLRFPQAEAAATPVLAERWRQRTYGPRARRDAEIDTEPPTEPVLLTLREPQLIHKGMGEAAIDIAYKPLPISVDVEDMGKVIHTVAQINEQHLQGISRSHRVSIPPPEAWRTGRPDLPRDFIPILNIRERAHRAGRRLANLRDMAGPRGRRWPRAATLEEHTEFDVVNNFVFSPVPQSTAILAHRAADHPLVRAAKLGGAAVSLLPTAKDVFTSLTQTLKDLHAAARRPVKEEKWDAHELNADALLQVETAIDAASQFVASATHGSLHPEHIHRIDRNELQRLTRTEAERGYEPLLRSRFELTTAPTTVAAVRVGGEVRRIQVLVWLPFVHKSGRMTAYKIVPVPIPTGHNEYLTLTPDQERIILVSRQGRTELSWTTLSATDFAACRPAGKSLTCPSMGTLRPPIDDQHWPRQDSDTCAYALYSRKTQLALTACARQTVHEPFHAHRLGPFTWAVFSQGVTTPQYDCPGVDPTRPQQIQGLALLRLPARCRALAAGWELIADDSNAALHSPAIFAYDIIGLPTMLGRLRQQDPFPRQEPAPPSYEYHTGPPPTDSPPFGFVFGDTESTAAILGLIIVLVVQTATNAALFYHFRRRFRVVRHALSSILLGEEEEASDRDGVVRLATVINRIYARLEYQEAMVINMCAALQRNKLRFQMASRPPPSVYQTALPGATDETQLALLP